MATATTCRPRFARRPTRPGWLARLGDLLARRQRAVVALQWLIVVAYALLIVVPAVLPLPASGATIASDLTLFAQFAFWGVWWPGVIVSTMLFGRVWCGLLCPEGTLTEFASRRGLGRPIPRWIRWAGWPVVAFVATTIYGQLISVYEYPKAALLILGGSTVAAVLVGLVYGRGKRVWCRYLCPVAGVFALLARVAPVHFRVDADAWRRYPERTPAVDCPPLLNVPQLQGNAQCHACGRCSGHRDAVQLATRSPNAEILAGTPRTVATSDAWLLIFGMLGVAVAAFQWTLSPWFVALRQRTAEWLVEHDQFALLGDQAPWWLLTHYPENNDTFTWLDGLLILVYIGLGAVLIGGCVMLSVRLAARIARGVDWRVLSTGLIPLAGIGAFLGLSMLTLTQLRAEGVMLSWLAEARSVLLGIGLAWSAWLGRQLIRAATPQSARALAAWCVYALALATMGLVWTFTLFVWQG